jgi:hypothetical protein
VISNKNKENKNKEKRLNNKRKKDNIFLKKKGSNIQKDSDFFHNNLTKKIENIAL